MATTPQNPVSEIEDRRLLERQLRLGQIKQPEYEALLENLPDVSARGVEMPLDSFLEEAVSATAARRARALEEEVDHRLPMAARNEDEHYEDEIDEFAFEEEEEDDE